LENQRGKDDKIFRELWEAVEAKVGKIRVGKTKKRRKKGRREKETRREETKEERRKKKQKKEIMIEVKKIAEK